MYTDFYQFSEKPFEDNPDPKFLYMTPSYKEALASILTWIRDGHGFSAITGEAGTGKTYFIHTLVNHIDEKVKTIIILYPTITFKELLGQILLELNQPSREKTTAALFHQFTRCLDQLTIEDKTLLIIFDEAQGLNDKTLEDIARFLDLRSKPIRIIFVGQPHFDERISSPGLSKLGKRIKVKHRIKSFTEVESREYIDHRLGLVGSRSQIFTPKAISMICSYTQGIPSLINHVCDNAFRVGFTMNQGKIDIDIIEEVIQNLSGPGVPRKILRSIPVRQIRWFPIRFPTPFKRVSVAIFFLVFLAGIFFLFYEYLGRGSIEIQGIKSFIESKLAMRPFTHKPSAEGTIESILRKDRAPLSEESKLSQPESSSVYQGAVFLTPGREKQQFMEVKVVERGEFLFSLAKKYYHMTNTTLIALILDCNPEITNVNLISLNQKIKIPKITEESLITQYNDHTYKIHVGTFQNSSFVRFYRNEPVLKGKVIEVFSRKVSPKENWYWLVVGPFAHKDDCLKVIDQLKGKGLLPAFGGVLKAE
jgi:general secretion pathway protein A